MNKTKFLVIIILAVLLISLTAVPVLAVTINSIDSPELAPGEQGQIRIEIENNLNDIAKDVSISLNFANIQFIAVRNSEDSVDEIDEGDEERFTFTIKASNEITPGDYSIPYTLNYKVNDEEKTRTGSIGIKVRANPILSYSVTSENAVINQEGKVSLKIVNKGFFDARFVSVRVLPGDFTLLSDDEEYIGSVDSDDFETATFDVIFNKQPANFQAVVEYIDFDNKKVIDNIDLPLTVYTKEKAIELGIIQKSNAPLYTGIIITLILAFILYRTIRRRTRLKRSQQLQSGR